MRLDVEMVDVQHNRASNDSFLSHSAFPQTAALQFHSNLAVSFITTFPMFESLD